MTWPKTYRSCAASEWRQIRFTASSTPRLFVTDDLAPGRQLALVPAQAHYLGTVLRRGAGQALRLFNGRDGEFRAELTLMRRDRAEVEVDRKSVV